MNHRKTIALLLLLAVPLAAPLADEGRMLADELANAPGRSDEDKARDAQRKPDRSDRGRRSSLARQKLAASRDGRADETLDVVACREGAAEIIEEA